jgi:hypothetical protein
MGTIVTFLLDKSGSMEAVKDDTIGAYNGYLDKLQEDPADMTFSLVQFDSISIETTCKNVPVSEAPKLTGTTYLPRAWTPLVDAAVKTIKAVEEAVALEKNRGSKVVIAIQTDGVENASREHTTIELQSLIKEKTALGWQFIFMGCGVDAYAQASQYGIARGSTLSYSKDRVATQNAFAATAQNTSSFARGASMSAGYSDAQKLASGDPTGWKKNAPLGANLPPMASLSPIPTPGKPEEPIVDNVDLK